MRIDHFHIDCLIHVLPLLQHAAGKFRHLQPHYPQGDLGPSPIAYGICSTSPQNARDAYISSSIRPPTPTTLHITVAPLDPRQLTTAPTRNLTQTRKHANQVRPPVSSSRLSRANTKSKEYAPSLAKKSSWTSSPTTKSRG